MSRRRDSLSKLVQVEVSFFLGEEATQEAKTRQSIFCSKNHQILTLSAKIVTVSDQTSCSADVVCCGGAVSKKRFSLLF
jgi:Tfp pilus tip-associated adhesin PilY1